MLFEFWLRDFDFLFCFGLSERCWSGWGEDELHTNIVNCYYPSWKCVGDRTWLRCKWMRTTPKMRSLPTALARSFPGRESFLAPRLKWTNQSFRNAFLFSSKFKILEIEKSNSLGHGEYGASSVESPQWLIPSQTKSAEMQNSVDLHLNSLQEWSETQKFSSVNWVHTQMKCNQRLLIFLMAVKINLKPLESVPQPSVMYLSVKKLLWVIMFPTDCFVFRQDMSICERKPKKNVKKTFLCSFPRENKNF